MDVTLGVTWGQDRLSSPTWGPGEGESEAVSDAALGEVSLVGFDRNQPNHLNPELWEMEIVTVNKNGMEGEDVTATQDVPHAGPEQAQFCPGQGRHSGH